MEKSILKFTDGGFDSIGDIGSSPSDSELDSEIEARKKSTLKVQNSDQLDKSPNTLQKTAGTVGAVEISDEKTIASLPSPSHIIPSKRVEPEVEPWHMVQTLPPEILNNSPSKRDGISVEDEKKYRIWGCELIQEAGILLRLPQVVMATGQNLLHRFFYRRSLKRFDAFTVAMGCLFLSCKVEEKPKRLREILFVFHHIFQMRRGVKFTSLELGGQQYTQWKSELIKMERHILKELGFSFYNIMDHPHKFILYYIKVLDGSNELAQKAWNYLNDSLRLDYCLRYRAEVIACAAIYMAARVLQVPLPTSPPWWELFNTKLTDISIICNGILSIFKLEKMVWLEPFNETSSFTRGSQKWDEEESERSLLKKEKSEDKPVNGYIEDYREAEKATADEGINSSKRDKSKSERSSRDKNKSRGHSSRKTEKAESRDSSGGRRDDEKDTDKKRRRDSGRDRDDRDKHKDKEREKERRSKEELRDREREQRERERDLREREKEQREREKEVEREREREKEREREAEVRRTKDLEERKRLSRPDESNGKVPSPLIIAKGQRCWYHNSRGGVEEVRVVEVITNESPNGLVYTIQNRQGKEKQTMRAKLSLEPPDDEKEKIRARKERLEAWKAKAPGFAEVDRKVDRDRVEKAHLGEETRLAFNDKERISDSRPKKRPLTQDPSSESSSSSDDSSSSEEEGERRAGNSDKSSSSSEERGKVVRGKNRRVGGAEKERGDKDRRVESTSRKDREQPAAKPLLRKGNSNRDVIKPRDLDRETYPQKRRLDPVGRSRISGSESDEAERPSKLTKSTSNRSPVERRDKPKIKDEGPYEGPAAPSSEGSSPNVPEKSRRRQQRNYRSKRVGSSSSSSSDSERSPNIESSRPRNKDEKIKDRFRR